MFLDFRAHVVLACIKGVSTMATRILLAPDVPQGSANVSLLLPYLSGFADGLFILVVASVLFVCADLLNRHWQGTRLDDLIATMVLAGVCLGPNALCCQARS